MFRSLFRGLFRPAFCPPAALALGLLAIPAGPASGDCISVVRQVKVKVAACGEPAEAAEAMRKEYAAFWQRDGGRTGLPSPDRFDFATPIREETGKILRGRVISTWEAAAGWKPEADPEERLFVWKAPADCRQIRPGDELEMTEESACCDVRPQSTVACILETSLLEPPPLVQPAEPTQVTPAEPAAIEPPPASGAPSPTP